mgnify:FL=1
MDSNLTTADFLALENPGFGRGYDDYGCRRHGAATTGIGLAAGLGGGALLLALAGLWGVNQASKARQKAAEAAAAGNKSAIDILTSQTLVERQSRETWQNNHAPTISQYVDVRAGAGAGAGANALATAEALSIIANSGRNGQVCPQPVALYQPAMPCSCNTCGN